MGFEQFQIGVVELAQDQRAEAYERRRSHLRPLFGGHASQLHEVAQQELQGVQRDVMEALGGRGDAPGHDLLVAFNGLSGQRVQLFHELRVGEAVGEGLLAVNDLARLDQRGKHSRLAYSQKELVAPGHGLEQRGKPEVLDQAVAFGRQLAVQLEILARVHEQDFHPVTFVLTLRWAIFFDATCSLTAR